MKKIIVNLIIATLLISNPVKAFADDVRKIDIQKNIYVPACDNMITVEVSSSEDVISSEFDKERKLLVIKVKVTKTYIKYCPECYAFENEYTRVSYRIEEKPFDV